MELSSITEKRGRIGKAIFSLFFIIVGIYLIYYAYGRPCDIGPITQNVQGQVATIENPAEMDRLVCLSADKVALVTVLIGTAMIFPGVGGLYRVLMEREPQEHKSKKKRR
jgi:hypothetical protein